MTDSRPIDRTTRTPPIAAVERQQRLDRRSAEEPVPASSEAAAFDGVPATIPDDVLAEVDDALDRLEDLRADGTTVRFHAGDGTGTRIELIGPDGEGRDVAPSELFGVVDGTSDPATPPAAQDAPAGPHAHVDRRA